MLTVEDLMKPRYKVIADYPGCGYEVGDIIVEVNNDLQKFVKQGDDRNFKYIQYPGNYKANFQRIHWADERPIEDMPKYIKGKERVYEVTEWRKDIFGYYYPMNKVESFLKEDGVNFSNIEWHFFKDKFFPVTLDDYTAYINQQH